MAYFQIGEGNHIVECIEGNHWRQSQQKGDFEPFSFHSFVDSPEEGELVGKVGNLLAKDIATEEKG